MLTRVDLIHDERNTLEPYQASKEEMRTDKTLEDKVKLALGDYINARLVTHSTLTDDELLFEAQNIVREIDTKENSLHGHQISWFRDLIMLSRFSQRGSPEMGSDASLNAALNATWAEKVERSKGREPPNLGHGATDKMEKRLVEFVASRQALGLTPTDSELQVQACMIIDEIEPMANFKCQGAVQWFKFLITSSTSWLSEFRRRAGLPRSSELAYEHIRSTDDKTIDFSIHNSYRLQRELKDWVQLQRAIGKTPSDADIQSQARLIIYGSDDTWNQTVLDDINHLNTFKRQNGLAPTFEGALPVLPEAGDLPPAVVSTGTKSTSGGSSPTLHWALDDRGGIGLPSPLSEGDRLTISNLDQALHTHSMNQPSTNTNPTVPLRYFLNDANCYGRLAKELTRFVMSCLSPNNPLQHVGLTHILTSHSISSFKVKSLTLSSIDPV